MLVTQKESAYFFGSIRKKSYLCTRLKRKEGWQSDRSRWTRNPVYPFGYRGFESLTFRQKEPHSPQVSQKGTQSVPFFSIWLSASYVYAPMDRDLNPAEPMFTFMSGETTCVGLSLSGSEVFATMSLANFGPIPFTSPLPRYFSIPIISAGSSSVHFSTAN